MASTDSSADGQAWRRHRTLFGVRGEPPLSSTFDKPPGLPVFPLHEDQASDCVLARVLARDPGRAALPWPPGFEGGIAHRLDTSTSGAVLLADDPAELAALREAFARGLLCKTYVFRARGDVPWNHNRIERPLAHDRRHKGRMVVQRGPETPHRGRWYPARTTFARRPGALWEAVIETGVMHQIRAHAAFLGLALAGDRTYGGGPTPPDAPPGATFLLHHEGLEGPGVRTEPVPLPAWARPGPR